MTPWRSIRSDEHPWLNNALEAPEHPDGVIDWDLVWCTDASKAYSNHDRSSAETCSRTSPSLARNHR